MNDRRLEPLELTQDSYDGLEDNDPTCSDRYKKLKKQTKNPSLIMTVVAAMIVILFALKYHYSSTQGFGNDNLLSLIPLEVVPDRYSAFTFEINRHGARAPYYEKDLALDGFTVAREMLTQ